MPNCYTLTRKTEADKGPVDRIKLDEELCRHFGVEPHPVRWYANWDNVVGLGLAMGLTFDKIREVASRDYTPEYLEELLPVIDYIEANFTSNAWYERSGARV